MITTKLIAAFSKKKISHKYATHKSEKLIFPTEIEQSNLRLSAL